MNFQKIPPVENHKGLLDLAFSKARAKHPYERSSASGKDYLESLKKKESTKIDIIKDVLNNRLQEILSQFPETLKLPKFYQDLIHLTVDYPQLKKSFGSLVWAKEKISFFSSFYNRKISSCRQPGQIKSFSREYYGRISSLIKQININLQYLEEARKTMRTYPDIKEMFTVCIYGFPNVGKTTLLNRITGTKAKIADYSFTTTSINAGYLELTDFQTKIQVLDVPGTLNRQDKMNNIELQAELVLTDLANLIIFVFDLSESCKYSFEKQEQLLRKIKELKKPVLVYLSKSDLLQPETISSFKYKHNSLEEIKRYLSEMI
jgi:nucleolar GTP-binding protein